MTIFNVMDEMSKQNKDVRLFCHLLGSELKGKKGAKYGQLSVQIDEQTHNDIAEALIKDGKPLRIALVVMDAEQYNEIANASKK